MARVGTSAPPAMAVVDAEGRILHTTEPFRALHPATRLSEDSFPELGLVITGQADSATLSVGDTEFTIEPADDGSGVRRALLTVEPAGDEAPAADTAPADPVALLREALEHSSAIAWMKDLDGRYTYVNAAWTEALGSAEDAVVGLTDEQLPPLETVDGPRVKLGQESSPKPHQLEYTVPAYEGRGGFAALRFVVLDGEGQSAAVCGVASPIEQGQLAREEASRLMRIQRWSRMDSESVRGEVLADWHVAPGTAGAVQEVRLPAAGRSPQWQPPPLATSPAPKPLGDSAGTGDPEFEQRFDAAVQQLVTEASRWRAELDRARVAAEAAQAEASSARAQLEQLRSERDELEHELAVERERGAAVVQALGQVRARIADLDSSVDQALTVETGSS